MHQSHMGDPKEFVKPFLIGQVRAAGVTDRVLVVPFFTGSALGGDALQTYATIVGVPASDVGPRDRFPRSDRDRPAYFADVDRRLSGSRCGLLDVTTGVRDRRRDDGKDEEYLTVTEVQRLLAATDARLLLVYDESYARSEPASKSAAVTARLRAIGEGVPGGDGFAYFGGGVNVLVVANVAGVPLLRALGDRLASVFVGCPGRLVR